MIICKGKDDRAFMSMAAFEERENMFWHRNKVYAAEMSRLNGEPVYTPEEMDAKMETLFHDREK